MCAVSSQSAKSTWTGCEVSIYSYKLAFSAVNEIIPPPTWPQWIALHTFRQVVSIHTWIIACVISRMYFQSFHKERVKGFSDYQGSYWDVNPAAVFSHFSHTCCANNTPARITSERICSLKKWHVHIHEVHTKRWDSFRLGQQSDKKKSAFLNQMNTKIHTSRTYKPSHVVPFSTIKRWSSLEYHHSPLLAVT